jgi:TatA/E family protein of Tat protein translocase
MLSMPFINGIGPFELVIILVIALIVVGPGRLPDVGAALGKSIREFRKAATDVKDATSLEPAKSASPAAPAQSAPVAAPVASPPVASAPPPAPSVPVSAPPAAPDAATATSDIADTAEPVPAADEQPSQTV